MKAEEFDAKFDAGEDMSEFLDFSTARRPQAKTKNRTGFTLLDHSQTRSRSQKGVSTQTFLRKL
jgi:hypothetical protein